jgi:hypothetical protein
VTAAPPAVEREPPAAESAPPNEPVRLAAATAGAVVTANASEPSAEPVIAAAAPAVSEPARQPVAVADNETFRPNEVSASEPPPFRRRSSKGVVVVVMAAVVAAGFVAWQRLGANRGLARTAQNAVPAKVVAPPAPRPAVAELTPPPVAAPAASVPEAAPSSPAPSLAAAVASSSDKPATSVVVTVKTVPPGAAIFEAGKRIGTGDVEVSVVPSVKKRLTALLDGYEPVNFSVDGTRDSVTLLMRRPQRRAETSESTESPAPAEKSAAESPKSDVPAAAKPSADTPVADAPAADSPAPEKPSEPAKRSEPSTE